MPISSGLLAMYWFQPITFSITLQTRQHTKQDIERMNAKTAQSQIENQIHNTRQQIQPNKFPGRVAIKWEERFPWVFLGFSRVIIILFQMLLQQKVYIIMTFIYQGSFYINFSNITSHHRILTISEIHKTLFIWNQRLWMQNSTVLALSRMYFTSYQMSDGQQWFYANIRSY